MVDYSKDLLLKMEYLKAVVDEVGKQPFVGTNSNVIYEAVWSIRYLDKVMPNMKDQSIRSTALDCMCSLEQFLSLVDYAKADNAGSDMVNIMKLKYGDACRGAALETARVKLDITDIATPLFISAVLAIATFVINKIANSVFLDSVSTPLFKVTAGLSFAGLLVFVGGIVYSTIKTIVSVCYMCIPVSRGIFNRKVPSSIHADLIWVYNRKMRSIKWLSEMSTHKFNVSVVQDMLMKLSSATGRELYENLVDIEDLYDEYVRYNSERLCIRNT